MEGVKSNIYDLRIPEEVRVAIQNYSSDEGRYDSARNVIINRLNHLSKSDFVHMSILEKCKLIDEVQLAEWARRLPTIELAKTIFSLNKERCVKAKKHAFLKPLKSRRSEISLDDQPNKSIREKRAHNDLNDVEKRIQPENEAEMQKPINLFMCQANDAHPRPSQENVEFCEPKAKNRQKRVAREKIFHTDVAISPDLEQNESLEKEEVIVEPTTTTICFQKEGNQNMTEDNSDDRDLSDEIDVQPIRPATSKKRAAAIAAASAVSASENFRIISPRKKSSYIVVNEEKTGQNEPTYCICQQASFGQMIMCDNNNCPIEWFHFSCVGLASAPKGKWFCDRCIDVKKKK